MMMMMMMMIQSKSQPSDQFCRIAHILQPQQGGTVGLTERLQLMVKLSN